MGYGEGTLVRQINGQLLSYYMANHWGAADVGKKRGEGVLEGKWRV